MGVAEELAGVWRDVPEKPQPGNEPEYFALLLRLTLDSKKRVEDTGRRYATLPTLRDLIRKRIVRVPAEHVKWLEISAFDLVANPLKKSLQAFASHLRDADAPLVDWFVHAAKKDPSLALDVKALEEWLKTRQPPSNPVASDSFPTAGPSHASAKTENLPASTEPAALAGSASAEKDNAPVSEEKPQETKPQDGSEMAPDRVFESS